MCYNIKLMCPSSTTALFIIFEKGNSKEGILFIFIRKGHTTVPRLHGLIMEKKMNLLT